jgi:hypothetical protein
MGTTCCRCLCVLTSLSSAPIRTRPSLEAACLHGDSMLQVSLCPHCTHFHTHLLTSPIGAASSLGDTVLLICPHSHTRAGDTHAVGVCLSTSQHFCSLVLTLIPNIARCALPADRSVPRQPHSRQRAGLPRCAARREEPRTLHSTPQLCVATAHAGTAHSSTASINLHCVLVFGLRSVVCPTSSESTCMPLVNTPSLIPACYSDVLEYSSRYFCFTNFSWHRCLITFFLTWFVQGRACVDCSRRRRRSVHREPIDCTSPLVVER